jgi:hypothetical protein
MLCVPKASERFRFCSSGRQEEAGAKAGQGRIGEGTEILFREKAGQEDQNDSGQLRNDHNFPCSFNFSSGRFQHEGGWSGPAVADQTFRRNRLRGKIPGAV